MFVQSVESQQHIRCKNNLLVGIEVNHFFLARLSILSLGLEAFCWRLRVEPTEGELLLPLVAQFGRERICSGASIPLFVGGRHPEGRTGCPPHDASFQFGNQSLRRAL